MIIKAIASTPRGGKWGVEFYSPEGGEGPRDYTAPAFFLPCYSYEHARAVCDAYNAGHIQPQPARVPFDAGDEELEGN